MICSVPEKGVSGTEYPFRTVEACFLHRMPLKMRRVPQEPVFCTARIFRTVGGPLRYRISQMPERRKALPAPNLSNCQKREGHGPEHVPECRREQENNSLRPQNTPANSTTTQRPTTATHPATHSANKKHHQYKTPPASTVTPPRLSEKSASQSAIGLLGHSGRGRTNRRGTFRTGSPTGTKKKPRLNVTSIGTSEKRQLPTLPPGGAVPSALVSLTSLFGMGRGGSSPL